MRSPAPSSWMRWSVLLFALSGALQAQTPPPAVVPFLGSDPEVVVVVDVEAVRRARLFAEGAPSPIAILLADLGTNSGLDVAALRRIAFVRRAIDDSTAPGEMLLVLEGANGLRLPAATDAMPACEVAGRAARSLARSKDFEAVLVEVADGVLLAGRRSFVESRLGEAGRAATSTEAAAAAAVLCSQVEGRLARVALPLARDGVLALAPGTARRPVGHEAARVEFSLMRRPEEAGRFELQCTLGAFGTEVEAARCYVACEFVRVALAEKESSKSLHAFVARANVVVRGREVGVDVILGEAADARLQLEAMVRLAGLPLPAVR